METVNLWHNEAMNYFLAIILTLIPIVTFGNSSHIREFQCAIAMGYPPFQYVEEQIPKGIDVKIIELFNKYNKNEFKVLIVPMLWSDAIASLNFTKKLDCIWGMEITLNRQQMFLFSSTLYERNSVLVSLKDSRYKKLDDLDGKMISSDEDTLLNDELKKMSKFRLIKVDTKEKAFDKLVSKKIAAAILPSKVANYFAKKKQIDIQILKSERQGAAVAVAAKSAEIAGMLEKGIKRIPKSEITKILNQY